MVEESTAASHGLAREAAALNDLLRQFKVSGAKVSAPAVASRPAAAPVSPAAAPKARPSPARALGAKLASAFGGKAQAAAQEASWEEF